MPILACPDDNAPHDGATVTLRAVSPAEDDALRRELAAGWPHWGEDYRRREAALQASRRHDLALDAGVAGGHR